MTEVGREKAVDFLLEDATSFLLLHISHTRTFHQQKKDIIKVPYSCTISLSPQSKMQLKKGRPLGLVKQLKRASFIIQKMLDQFLPPPWALLWMNYKSTNLGIMAPLRKQKFFWRFHIKSTESHQHLLNEMPPISLGSFHRSEYS